MNNKQYYELMTMEEFDKILDIQYTKYQIKFTLKMIQHIVQFHYHDKNSVDCISGMVISLLEDIKNGKTDKKKLKTINNYISLKFDELSGMDCYNFPDDENHVWVR